MIGTGLILMLIGAILWLTAWPGIGAALLIIGAVIAIVSAIAGRDRW